MSGGLTLAVTSSTGVMGLAIGQVSSTEVAQLAAVEVVTDRRHAEEISPRLQELLVEASVSISDLDGLVVDIGPGRFTGLRVGLASVRALSFALGLPVVGLTSLSILAAGAPAGAEMVTAVIDARRNEVFQQSFRAGVPVDEPRVGSADVLAAEAGGVVLGDGYDRYAEAYQASRGRVLVADQNPQAPVMLELSRGMVGKPGTEITPLYLRDPDANPNIKTRPTA